MRPGTTAWPPTCAPSLAPDSAVVVLAGPLLPERIRRRALAFPLRDAAIHVCLALFFVLFLTQLDKQPALRGWGPPGIALFAACMAAFALCLLAGGAWSRRDLREHLRALAHRYWPFALAFAALAVFSLANWFRAPDPSAANAVSIALPLAICGAATLLPLASRVRRHWRTYLWIAFAALCLSVWADAIRVGTFALHEYRVAGLPLDSNHASHLLLLLAAPLVAERRPGPGAPAALFLAGSTVFLTLSRGGLMLFILLALCALAFSLWRTPPGRRLRRLSVFAAAGALTALVCWVSVQTLPYFTGLERARAEASSPDVVRGVDQFLDVRGWFTRRWHAADEDAFAGYRQRLDGFGRIDGSGPPDLAREENGVVEFDDARVVRLRNGLDAIAASPIVGHGTGFSATEGIDPHVMYLDLWIDHGLFGALAFLALLGTALWAFARPRFWPGVFVVGFIVCWSLHSQAIFDTRPLFILLGMLLALPLVTDGEREGGAA